MRRTLMPVAFGVTITPDEVVVTAVVLLEEAVDVLGGSVVELEDDTMTEVMNLDEVVVGTGVLVPPVTLRH